MISRVPLQLQGHWGSCMHLLKVAMHIQMVLTDSGRASMELMKCNCHVCNELIELNGQVYSVNVLPWKLEAYPELYHAWPCCHAQLLLIMSSTYTTQAGI